MTNRKTSIREELQNYTDRITEQDAKLGPLDSSQLCSNLAELDLLLSKYLDSYQTLVLAYSGGIDSSLLAQRLDFLVRQRKAAAEISEGEAAQANKQARGQDQEPKPAVLLLSFQHEFVAARDLDLAQINSRPYELEHVILVDTFLTKQSLISNGPDRCYLCKKKIFTRIIDFCEQELGPQDTSTLPSPAKEQSYLILEGSNYSDLDADRPGRVAIQELGIKSPLEEVQLGKSEIRELAKELGMANWDQVSQSCLATRIPTGQIIREDKLALIEAGEDFLNKLGFRDRVRLILEQSANGKYRLQLNYQAAEEELFSAKKKDIENYLQDTGYTFSIVRKGDPDYGTK